MSAPEGDVGRGEALFKGRCAQCHTTNKVGSFSLSVNSTMLQNFIYIYNDDNWCIYIFANLICGDRHN